MSITYYVLSTKNLVIFVSDAPLRNSKYFHNVITSIVSQAVKGTKCIIRFKCVRISKC